MSADNIGSTAPADLHVLIEIDSSDLRVGAVNDVLDFADYAPRLGVRVTFCGVVDDTFTAEARRRGASVLRSARSRPLSKRSLPSYATSVLGWLVRLRRMRVNIVHLNYLGWAPSLALAAHLAHVPIVSRAGGSYSPTDRTAAWIDAYVANCIPHAASLSGTPLESKVVVVGSLLNLSRLNPPRTPERPIPLRQIGYTRLLFLGQLVARKGVDTLVRALAGMQSKAEALLVGGNWDQPGYPRHIRDLVSSTGLENRVCFENFRSDAGALLDDCDIFVLPSRSDARPRSIIEAMYLGRAIVATRVGGIPTLIEHGVTGLLVLPDDPGSLAAALDRLAADPQLRERLGAAARAWAEAEIQPERAARRIAELYRSLAVRSVGRRSI